MQTLGQFFEPLYLISDITVAVIDSHSASSFSGCEMSHLSAHDSVCASHFYKVVGIDIPWHRLDHQSYMEAK